MDFEQTLKELIEAELKETNCLPVEIAEGFSIEPILAKKTVVKHFDIMLEASVGAFLIKGNPLLLNFLYLGGMGSRRSGGFGLFELI